MIIALSCKLDRVKYHVTVNAIKEKKVTYNLSHAAALFSVPHSIQLLSGSCSIFSTSQNQNFHSDDTFNRYTPIKLLKL